MNRILKLERHRYAPELNKLYYKGVCFRVPGASSINQALDYLKFRKAEFIKHCKITVKYPDEFRNLNTVKGGTFKTYNELLTFLRNLKKRHKGGVLLDGSILPDPVITVKIQSVFL